MKQMASLIWNAGFWWEFQEDKLAHALWNRGFDNPGYSTKAIELHSLAPFIKAQITEVFNADVGLLVFRQRDAILVPDWEEGAQPDLGQAVRAQ